MAELTPKQQLFINAYLVEPNATKAAIAAGYSAKSAGVQGCKLLKNPNVLANVLKVQQPRELERQIDRNYILDNLSEVVERCMQRAPVMVKAEGGGMKQLKDDEDRNVWTFNANGAIAALQMLGKNTGGFSDKLEVSHTYTREEAARVAHELLTEAVGHVERAD